jgi:hypothetical protein
MTVTVCIIREAWEVAGAEPPKSRSSVYVIPEPPVTEELDVAVVRQQGTRIVDGVPAHVAGPLADATERVLRRLGHQVSRSSITDPEA